MKTTLSISLAIMAAISAMFYTPFIINAASASTESKSSGRFAYLTHLPPELVVPAVLPPAIQDTTLMEAWIRLYNHQDPIQLWDGSSLTGRSLAEYLLDHSIPIVWDKDNVCGNGSCSVKRCDAGTCTFEDDQPGVAPIYVRTAERGDMPALVDTLAHETFHRTQPFGPVGDTRFEEYWAFRVEYHINAETWLTFGGYDPLDPNHLNLWIRDNRLDPYFQLPEYPASVEPLVVRPNHSTGGACEGLPAAAFGTDQGNAK